MVLFTFTGILWVCQVLWAKLVTAISTEGFLVLIEGPANRMNVVFFIFALHLSLALYSLILCYITELVVVLCDRDAWTSFESIGWLKLLKFLCC